MRKPTSSTQLAAFLFVDSEWHEPHDAVQCHAHGSTFEFLFEFQTEFFSNFCSSFKLFENQTDFRGSTLYEYAYCPQQLLLTYSIHYKRCGQLTINVSSAACTV